MRLYFIRHGQSANNALWDEKGSDRGRSEDPELTKTGHEQAELLAQHILKIDTEARSNGQNSEPKRDFYGFTHLYTSLMVRSVATATHLSRALGLQLTAWPEIHECGGIYLDDEQARPQGLPGKTPAYFKENYSHLILPSTVNEMGWWNRPFEAYEERPLRAQAFLQALKERHGGSNDCVAIVSHGGFYMELIRVMFKIGEENSWFRMQNTAVSRFEFYPNGETTLIYHNNTSHLPERLIT